MENQSKEVIMVHYLEVVLKRDFAYGWKHALERLRMFFDNVSEVDSKEKAGEVDCNEKTGEMDWKEKFGRKWYY
jgi:hypothetical protein